jgi:hypothetical protein
VLKKKKNIIKEYYKRLLEEASFSADATLSASLSREAASAAAVPVSS